MTPRNAIFASASLACAVFSAGAARAEMTCAVYLRGAVAEDSYVLREAADIAVQLIDSDWLSPAMRTDAETIAPTKDRRQRLVLRQLTRDCRALPRTTIDRLVAVHLQVFHSN